MVWSGREAGSYSANGNEVRARVYDASGNPLGNDVLVNTITDRQQFAPEVVALANGGFAVTWVNVDVQLVYSHYARFYDAAGAAISAATQTQAFTPAPGVWDIETVALSDGSLVNIYPQGFFPVTLWADGVAAPTAPPASTTPTAGPDTLTGDGGVNTLVSLAGDDTLNGLGGNDNLDGGQGIDKALYGGQAKDYAWWQADDGSWRVQDLRNGSPEGTDTLLSIEQLVFADRTIKIAGATNAELLSLAFEQVMRIATPTGANQTFLNGLITAVDGGAKTLGAAYGEIVQRADGSTAVAAMTYQFFLGYAPSKGGFDYLVSPTGPNPNNINSAYFQFFSQENRYINFAVSVGSLGDGKAAFTADYGALTLRQATAKAYQEIFGGSAPGEAFLNLLLDSDVGGGLTRKDYFAYYGGDGLTGLGTKAAMVGWLLTEAAKADVGVFARSNNAYLQDLADGAPFLVDMVGVYAQPDWAHNPPG